MARQYANRHYLGVYESKMVEKNNNKHMQASSMVGLSQTTITAHIHTYVNNLHVNKECTTLTLFTIHFMPINLLTLVRFCNGSCLFTLFSRCRM